MMVGGGWGEVGCGAVRRCGDGHAPKNDSACMGAIDDMIWGNKEIYVQERAKRFTTAPDNNNDFYESLRQHSLSIHDIFHGVHETATPAPQTKTG